MYRSTIQVGIMETLADHFLTTHEYCIAWRFTCSGHNGSHLRPRPAVNARCWCNLYRPGPVVCYLSANELRHYFGVVPQETILFSGTIYDTCSWPIPMPPLIKSSTPAKWRKSTLPSKNCRKANQTEIGERGVGLSGGQKATPCNRTGTDQTTQDTAV